MTATARRYYEMTCVGCGFAFETTNPEDVACTSCLMDDCPGCGALPGQPCEPFCDGGEE